MDKQSEDFIKQLLKHKKIELDRLHLEHEISIAVYNAKRQMLMSDVDVLEKKIDA